MKGVLPLTLISALSLSLAGCASDYIMSTKDGRLITSHGKPRLDRETGMYRYEDENGREMQIRAEDIVQIVER
jgi:hypothetical protein